MIRSILASLLGDKFNKNFGVFGIVVYDASGEIRSLEDIFTDMSEAMDEMATQQCDSLIQDVFNSCD